MAIPPSLMSGPDGWQAITPTTIGPIRSTRAEAEADLRNLTEAR